MRLLITGATGFIGRHLIRRLSDEQHDLATVSRRPEAARRVLPEAVAVHPWGGAAAGPAPEALAGVEGVIHLAGEPIIGWRWTGAKKRRIHDSRVGGTRALVQALNRRPEGPPAHFLSASAVGYYGDRGDEVLTERAHAGEDFLARVCLDWEEAVVDNVHQGTRPVMMRFGMVLGRDGGPLPALLPAFRLGLGGPLGGGRQWLSWIHVADLAELVVHALHDPDLRGVVNAVAPEPVRHREFARALGSVLRRPAVLGVPRWALRLGLGEMSQMLLDSQRVVPEKARAHGFRHRFPDVRAALADLC